MNILEIKNLKTQFHVLDGVAHAVNNVSLSMKKGEVLGVVGESGSGKSVTALSLMGLVRPPGKIVSGEILFDGTDLRTLSEKQMREIRGDRISMIFQEPMTSLNPLLKIRDQISEMVMRHNNISKKDSYDYCVEMLSKVQIPYPEKRAKEYPHQLSGGMRQRVMIAMALSCNPEILIADEPTTALDVTIQAQVIDLMLKLKEEYDTGIIMITHDLGVIAEIARKVVVMYAGQVVETGDVYDIFDHPGHPYTKALLDSVPRLGKRSRAERKRLREIKGIVPDLFELRSHCNFYERCSEADEDCKHMIPDLIQYENGRSVRCIKFQGCNA
ncbi:MAG: ABC transporter ATP-binding protein [Desulfobacteraceae bacterium]|nr:ABC transporter ATP-binding protein [Desulfobacteraceae bacterium]